MSKVSIKINKLTKSFGARTILDKVSLDLPFNSRIALTGLNGCGKSTFLKILAGLEPSDGGKVQLISRGSVGYLPQMIPGGEVSLEEFLSNSAGRGGALSPWEAEKAVEETLNQVGLEQMDRACSIGLLSGGQKTRAYLGRLVLEKHSFLLLDEPTNYLDFQGLAWLEEFLSQLDAGILMVSHDRYFLDKMVNRVIHLEEGHLEEFAGNYTDYRLQKEKQKKSQWHQFKAQKREIRRMEAFVRREKAIQVKIDNSTVNDFARSRAKRHATKAKAMERRIERMEKVEAPRRDYLARVQFQGRAESRVVARAEDLSMGFGDRVLYRDVSFHVGAGEKVGIIGPNGSGKTTLLNLLRGKLKPLSGSAFLLSEHQVGYFSQVFEELKEKEPVLDQVMERTGLDMHQARQLLASFLFFGNDVFRPVEVLSVGERSRVSLACICAGNHQMLILDEPTNHLDVDTTEILEKALINFSGAVLIVTHDRFLLDQLAQRLLVIEDNAVNSYPGAYSYYQEKRISALRLSS